MRRLVSALTVLACALLPAATAGADAHSRPAQGAKELVSIEFDLPASDGFKAEVQATAEGSRSFVTLAVLDGSHSFVAYQVSGLVEQGRFEAAFGRLGYISFRFDPIKTVPGHRAAKAGCPRDVTKEGFFVGEARFVGEGGYTTIATQRVKGTVRVEPGRKCPDRRPAPSHARAKRSRYEKAALRASDRRARSARFFLAIGGTDHHTHRREASFLAVLTERREAVRIGRYTTVFTRRPGAFLFDHDAGTATIHPPAPFRGDASFVRHGGPKHPGRWRGNLSVPLLGHDPIRLTGPAFRAILNQNIPYDE